VPDDSFLEATRKSYDAMVEGYVELVDGYLERHPLDRALLTVFADLVRGAGNRPVADVGCGPGWATAFLHEAGLDAFGIDLSPAMITHARKTHPELRFEVGSMLALDQADASLGGLLAFFSITHIPGERRPEVFAEFHRVLEPGGRLILAFQVGDGKRHRDEAFGRAIDCDWHRYRPDDVVGLLRTAGFDLYATTIREAEDPDSLPQGYVIATKPA
jgi:SAM-dependent methyltransferase